MSESPAGNNNSNPREIYLSRESYDELYEEDAIQIDTWYQNPFYGKVNEEGEAVAINEYSLKYISDAFSAKQNACIIFAANAFLKMKLHYEVLYKQEATYQQSDFFTETLTDTRAWESPLLKYNDYIQDLFQNLVDTQLAPIRDSDTVKDFDDFVSILKNYLKDTKRPFTKKGFLESKFNPPSTTGMCIEIYDGDPADDAVKFDFIQDENYELFSQLCAKYGFKVDRNVPWRIYADIQTKAMQNYIMDEFDGPKRDVLAKDIFDKYYLIVDSFLYYEEFKTYLESFYVSYKQVFPFYKTREYDVTVGCGPILGKEANFPSLLTKIENRKKFTSLSDLQCLTLLYDIRVSEIGVTVTEEVRQFHLKNVAMIYNYYSYNYKTAIEKSVEYIKYNLGTVAYRYEPVEEINLQRENKQVIMTPQQKFDADTGEDISYL